jgi:hypothetical protein
MQVKSKNVRCTCENSKCLHSTKRIIADLGALGIDPNGEGSPKAIKSHLKSSLFPGHLKCITCSISEGAN